MTFTQSIAVCFQKYIVFSGRASRSEYWWFFLFTLIVRLITTWIPVLNVIVALALLLPSLAVTVRRLHDTNRTGWWVLLPIGLAVGGAVAGAVLTFAGLGALGIALVALGSIVGFVVLLVFLVQPSDPGPNQYGANPLQQSPGPGGYGYPQSGHPYSSHQPGGSGISAPGPEDQYLLPEATNRDNEESRTYCTNCGMQLQPDARFCSVCGTAA